VPQTTLRTLGDAPTWSLTERAQRVGVAEAEAAALIVLMQRPSTTADTPVPAPATELASPLLGTMAPNGVSGAPRIRLSRRGVIATRKNAIRHTMKNVLLTNAALTIPL
jgi:hypothetical protein